MRKILITGINGFAASHLAHALANEEDCILHGTIRVRSDLHRIDDINNKLTLHLVELTDAHSISGVIDRVRPDEIYHLAAQSYVKSSWDSPLETMNINYSGTVNLLEAVRKIPYYKPSILITSTSEVYGSKVGWIDENTPPTPNTPYGLAKLAQESISKIYQKAYDMHVMFSRSFNITGAGRVDKFVDSSFAKQIAEIEVGKKDPILYHGNLESKRDFINVSDAVNGYIKILRSQLWGEVFCLASGKPVSIQELLDTMISLAKVEIKDEVNPDLLRPIDTPSMQGDASKAKNKLDWVPTVPLKESCQQLLDYWRARV